MHQGADSYAPFQRFPVLAHWAIFLRPSDSGRGRIVAACEENEA
jgi:hypothetical protein